MVPLMQQRQKPTLVQSERIPECLVGGPLWAPKPQMLPFCPDLEATPIQLGEQLP
ncbi:conserved hypothetical protein [Stigmatella aurantiaca DW4/3-1]|uniref:Uncharacterized protein n=1 Tax=Stigmatella aurantiaca (strain DW4/3-1) TaxID=378806 RepID=Q091B9_STIAD|nr:conserved hypothetical protein [Stigmatella aurantiaca DW4/3-1]